MKAGRVLKHLKKKLGQVIDSLIPEAQPQLVPIPVRARKPRGRR